VTQFNGWEDTVYTFFYKLHETDLQLYAKRDKGEMVLAKQRLPDTKFSHVKSYNFKSCRTPTEQC